MLFTVLGPVGVQVDGRRTSFAPGHERTCLALLLAADGQAVSTERLIEALWGPAPPATARKSLQSHLSRLRRNLRELSGRDGAYVQGVPGGYRLMADGVDLDSRQFLTLTVRAHQASDPHQKVHLLEAAEACWTGPAFGDLAEHPALAGAAQHLQHQRREVAVERAEALLGLGQVEPATRLLRGILTEDPYDERSHGLMIRALLATGRRAEALGVYDRMRRRLRTEFGVDPAPELRGLYQQMLAQDALPAGPGPPVGALPHQAAGSPSDPAPPPPSGTPNTTGPPEPPAATAPAASAPPAAPVRRDPPLLGRHRDLDELARLLPGAALLTLTGPGRVGKTSLAEHVVARTGDAWRDGVLTCNLAHVRDPEAVGDALITALAIQPGETQSLTQALVNGLGERHLLLFLDNCEHVLQPATHYIDAIVSGCPGVTVLVTSRERLRLSNERVWPVTPLTVPPPAAPAGQVLGTPAGALFQARAQAVLPQFDIDEDNAAAVAELCRRLDGMPLAIELAAARVPVLSPQALAERLDQRFALLTGGPRHEHGRHQTLESVVAWSYELLAAEEADLFDRLAVFAGAVPLAAIEAVCADDRLPQETIAGLLGELVDKSMVVVQRTSGTERYRLLGTMRDFAARRVQQRGIGPQIQRAHARHYLAVAETEGARVRGPQEAEAVAALAAAMDDLRAAHAWAMDTGDTDVALRLPGALAEEVRFRLRDEVTTWARRALDLPGAQEHPARPGALATAAWGATSRDDCERAVHEATAAYRSVEPTNPVAFSAGSALATAALYQGRLADVLELADRDQPVLEDAGHEYHLAFLWVYRILAHLYRGDGQLAAAGLPQVHAAAEASGSPSMRAFALYSDGEVHLEQDAGHAATVLTEAVRLGRLVGNRLVEGVALVCLASSQGRRGDPGEALRAYREVVMHWRRVGDHTHQLTAVRNLVPLLARLGADREAALLHGAVTSAGTPSFGVEAERLATAWSEVERRLGTAVAADVAGRGRRIDSRLVGNEAMAVLDSLLGK